MLLQPDRQNADWGVRRTALDLTRSLPPPVLCALVPHLVQMLKSDDWGLRRQVSSDMRIQRLSRFFFSHMSQAHMSQAHMSQAHMSQAHMSQAHMSQAHMSQAHMSQAHLSQAHVPMYMTGFFFCHLLLFVDTQGGNRSP